MKDQEGRKKAMVYSWGISTLGALGIFLSSSVEQLVVMNFLFGFGSFATYVLGFVVLNEICSKELRQKACIGIMIAYSVFQISSAVVYYLISSWRVIFFFFILLPALLGYYLLLLMHETPRYYYSKGLIEKAFRVLEKMARFNGLTLDLHSDDLLRSQQASSKQYGYLDLFKYPSLRLASLGFICVSFAAHLLYYGGQFALAELGDGDMIYVFGLFVALSELLSYFLIQNSIQHLPRRLSSVMSFLLAILACALFAVYGLSAHSATVNCTFCLKLWYMITLACLIRIFTSFSFAIQTLFVNEFYPTKIRTIGSGFVFSVGIAGSFAAPFNVTLSQRIDLNPYLIIGALSLTGLFGTMLIRETLGCKLEDDIEEEGEGKEEAQEVN